MNPLVTAASLIINIALGGYIVILLLRLILQKLRANWHNPISQFVIKLTEKPLKPLRKIIPGIKGYDFSILSLALIFQFIEITLLFILRTHTLPGVIGMIILGLVQLISTIIYIYIYVIIINAIASWVPTLQTSPLAHIVYLIAHPILSRIQRIIPPIAGIDISPIIVLIGFYLINILVAMPIIALGINLAS